MSVEGKSKLEQQHTPHLQLGPGVRWQLQRGGQIDLWLDADDLCHSGACLQLDLTIPTCHIKGLSVYENYLESLQAEKQRSQNNQDTSQMMLATLFFGTFGM